MTTSRESPAWSYAGNGVAVDFYVDERVQSAAHLAVYLVTTSAALQTLDVHYSLIGVDDDNGVVVRFANAPPTGATILILLVPPLTQTADLRSIGGRFNAIIHEDAFDRLNQQIRRVWRAVQRSVRLPFTDGDMLELPSISGLLGKYLYVDASGLVTGVTGDPSQPMTHTAEVVTATAGQTVIPVSAYTPGSGDLLVFKNGALLTPGVQYTETTSTTYTLATPATLGDTLVNVIGAVFDVTLARMDSPQESITGITTPTMTLTTMSYVVGVDRVWVFMNGAKLDPGSYTQTNSTTITLGFTPVASDVFDVVVGTAININKVLVQPVDSLTIVSDGNTSQMLFAGPRGAVSRPEMNNILGCFNVAPKGVPPGTNVAWSVLRVWDADIVASDAGTRRGLGMEAHFDSDSVMRTRLVTRSEGSPSKKHTDVYYQLNGCNIQYYGAKRDGTTGTGSIGFYPRGMTFDATAYAAWAASTGVSIGQKRIVSRSDYIVLECTVAGTTGSVEPIPAQIGGTVVDGTVTWTSRSRLLPTTSTAVALWLDENGNVGVNTDAPDKGFDVATYARFQSGICGHAVTSAISGGLLTVDAETGNLFDVTVSTASAFTVTAPSNPNVGARITYRLKNTSGGAMGTVTWDAIYKMASWTSPATNYSRSIDFVYIGTNWVEVSRTTADIPN